MEPFTVILLLSGKDGGAHDTLCYHKYVGARDKEAAKIEGFRIFEEYVEASPPQGRKLIGTLVLSGHSEPVNYTSI